VIPILTYHQISPAPPRPAPYRSLYVTPADFATQMQWLRRLGYQGLSMRALLPYLQGQRRGKVVGITFDDGYLNNLTHAAPVLQALGFSATCYLVSQRMGQTNDWDLSLGVAQAPLMNLDQVRQWLGAGQDVGAHSRTHAHLPQLTSAQAHREIAGCRDELQAALDCTVTDFCYPYGEYLLEHVALVRDAGYTTATTTRRGRSALGGDALQLPRLPVVRRTTWPGLLWRMNSGYDARR
jgi:peptidoglycan/xylan/chitin deacetylase (PgdA/CDA1 family)